ncbi:hypothetical protein BRD02_07010 [Halobacteriales archaeon QS_8_69_73]|nr:MAG: hypothetical protein BRD02_07010 [Halobacteriales archaeon QS_8_69_73]
MEAALSGLAVAHEIQGGLIRTTPAEHHPATHARVATGALGLDPEAIERPVAVAASRRGGGRPCGADPAGRAGLLRPGRRGRRGPSRRGDRRRGQWPRRSRHRRVPRRDGPRGCGRPVQRSPGATGPVGNRK